MCSRAFEIGLRDAVRYYVEETNEDFDVLDIRNRMRKDNVLSDTLFREVKYELYTCFEKSGGFNGHYVIATKIVDLNGEPRNVIFFRREA